MKRWSNEEATIKIANISRLTNMMVILNITLFVTSGLVKGLEYFFPIIALVIFCLLSLVLIFPLTNIQGLRTYWIIFIAFLIGTYFTIASIVYLVEHEDFTRFIQ